MSPVCQSAARNASWGETTLRTASTLASFIKKHKVKILEGVGVAHERRDQRGRQANLQLGREGASQQVPGAACRHVPRPERGRRQYIGGMVCATHVPAPLRACVPARLCLPAAVAAATAAAKHLQRPSLFVAAAGAALAPAFALLLSLHDSCNAATAAAAAVVVAAAAAAAAPAAPTARAEDATAAPTARTRGWAGCLPCCKHSTRGSMTRASSGSCYEFKKASVAAFPLKHASRTSCRTSLASRRLRP